MSIGPTPDPKRSRQLYRQNILKTRRDLPIEKKQQLTPPNAEVGYAEPVDPRINPFGLTFEHFAQIKKNKNNRNFWMQLKRERPELLEWIENNRTDLLPDKKAEDEENEFRSRRKGKKQGISRRKLLVGLGLVAVGGAAAYELGPKIPQVINNVGTNLEHQLQDAYNKGLASGAEAVRKEFITSLNNLEGYSLQGAMTAARLTRLAYDDFVTPLVTLATTVTGDFLGITLQAVMSARGFLVKFNQDNSTLGALETVLTTWVKKVNAVPLEIQTITDADLDGAQSYLRALQRMLQDETAKLNSSHP